MGVFNDETPRQDYPLVSYRERDLTMAYASGRQDERETWEPVLEALKRCIGSLGVVSPGGRTDPDIVFAEAAIASVEGKS